MVNYKLVEIALEHISGSDFEAFFHAFYPSIAGVDFVPLGGMRDGGADAFQDSAIWEGTKAHTFYQASTQANHRAKIKATIQRLRDVGRDPQSLVFVSSKIIPEIDKEEERATVEFGAFVRIRDRRWIVANINSSPATVAAFDTYLRPAVAFLSEIGGAHIIETNRFAARTMCVFLGQEVERRRSKSDLLESVTDSLILWALEGTSPESGIFFAAGGDSKKN